LQSASCCDFLFHSSYGYTNTWLLHLIPIKQGSLCLTFLWLFRYFHVRFQISIMCCSSVWYCSIFFWWKTCLRVIFSINIFIPSLCLFFSNCTHCSSLFICFLCVAWSIGVQFFSCLIFFICVHVFVLLEIIKNLLQSITIVMLEVKTKKKLIVNRNSISMLRCKQFFSCFYWSNDVDEIRCFSFCSWGFPPFSFCSTIVELLFLLNFIRPYQ
jgi:hypothetical protein